MNIYGAESMEISCVFYFKVFVQTGEYNNRSTLALDHPIL